MSIESDLQIITFNSSIKGGVSEDHTNAMSELMNSLGFDSIGQKKYFFSDDLFIIGYGVGENKYSSKIAFKKRKDRYVYEFHFPKFDEDQKIEKTSVIKGVDLALNTLSVGTPVELGSWNGQKFIGFWDYKFGEIDLKQAKSFDGKQLYSIKELYDCCANHPADLPDKYKSIKYPDKSLISSVTVLSE
ncbi:hypothetical protein K9L67_02185 [Candidatus Woesearchaeota archaeon]|nr:hypothetical protein [Candidatus Woesearchaeota archaeon]MCF7901013.1 hypothetical protein [Candidatus Woesearchaeota archaeon]MCF8013271.1 hypothetical protein [Candidatus Woesearchaeota archaeon]